MDQEERGSLELVERVSHTGNNFEYSIPVIL